MGVSAHALLGALRSHGWSRARAGLWLVVVVLALGARWGLVRLQVSRAMDYTDLIWSSTALLGVTSCAALCWLNVHQAPYLALTAHRRLLPERLLVVSSSSVLAAWPTVLVLTDALPRLVSGLVAQQLCLLGLMYACSLVRRSWGIVPSAAVLLLAVLPAVLPLRLHPLTPAHHPWQLIATQFGVWLVGTTAWLCLPRRALTA